jgi:hypothetical protein
MKPAQKFKKLFLLFLTASILLSCGRENSEEPIEIPFTLEENRIVIYANVNGVEGRYFWDTGCFETVTTIPLGNLPVVKNDPYYNHKRYYIKNRIIINGHRLKTKSIITNPSPNMPRVEVFKSIYKDEGFDGALGYYIFTGYWCELSFTESKIILHKNKPEKFLLSASGSVTRWGHPCISVRIDSTYLYTFIVDTGMPAAFSFPKKFMQYIKPAEYLEILSINESYEGIYNDFGTHYEIPGRSISVLDDTFIDKYIITSGSLYDDEGAIGIKYLQYYDLLFDITFNNEPKSNWHLWELYYMPRFPDLDKNTLDLTYIRNSKLKVGISHMSTDQGRFLTGVWKPSIAYSEYGLMPGMTITHINGVFLNPLTNHEASPLFDEMADDDNCEIKVIDLDNGRRTIKRNQSASEIRWSFNTENERIKLYQLYPLTEL